MAGLKELVQQRLDRLDDIPALFVSTVEKQQTALFSRLRDLLDDMDTAAGAILFTPENIDRLNAITNTLVNEDLMQGEYGDALREYLREFARQGELDDQLVEKVIGRFTAKPAWKATIKEAQRITLSKLGANGIDQAFTEPIREQLLAAITNGVSKGKAMDNLREFILGSDEVQPRLVRHVRQIAYDAFAFTDRAYMNAVTKDLGLDFYEYAGGLIRDSRPFCVERAGKIFHRSEIEQWATLDWKGRTRGTDDSTIWTYAGGYNCQHVFMPVAASRVPKAVRERVSV